VKTTAGFEQKVRTNRLLMINSLVREGKRPNTGQLASKLEVTTRTIQRDIDNMRDMFGAPFYYDPNNQGFYIYGL
jgi:predicted DNA-binding transcriptional regulator YafY